MRAVIFSLLACGQASSLNSAQAQTITLVKGSTLLNTVVRPGQPGSGPLTVRFYEAKPSGTYDTSTSGQVHQIVVELGNGTTSATFAPHVPSTFPTDVNGNPIPSVAVALSALPTGWALPANASFAYSITSPPGPGSRAMRAQLQKQGFFTGTFSGVADAVAALP